MVFSILTVSGRREESILVGNWPSNNALAAAVSALRPMVVANGPDPKGVLIAWLYCLVLMEHTILAISSGFVIDNQGPFQVLGSVGEPKLGPLAD